MLERQDEVQSHAAELQNHDTAEKGGQNRGIKAADISLCDCICCCRRRSLSAQVLFLMIWLPDLVTGN